MSWLVSTCSRLPPYAPPRPVAGLTLHVPPALADACRHAQVEVGVLERRWADQVAVVSLVEAEVLRPITASQRNAAWAAGDVLDEADLLVDRLRLHRLVVGLPKRLSRAPVRR